MKLMILVEEPYPFNEGGEKRYLEDFEKGLRKEKIDYEIITTRLEKDRVDNPRVKILGARLWKNKSFILRSLHKLYYFHKWFKAVFKYLENGKCEEFDIMNVQDIIFSGKLGLKLKKKYNLPLVITRHGLMSEVFRLRTGKFFSHWMLKRIEKKIISQADLVICVGRDVLDFYSKMNKNCVFIPNFIDLSEFKKKQRKEIHTIGYVGRLSREKNVHILIEAAKFFPQKKFLIVGTGPEEASLRRLASGMKNVEFLGYRNDIPKVLERIDLFVTLCEAEAFGLSALEAVASGIPVIAADAGEIRYFIGEKKAGILLPKEKINVQQIINAIRKINKKNISKFSRNAINSSKEYDYRQVIKKYKAAFESVYSKHR